MRRVVAAFLVALVLPGVAAAKSTSLFFYSTLDDHPGGVFLNGDSVRVIAHGFEPDVGCAVVKFTLTDSAGHKFHIGDARPGFGQWGEGFMTTQLDAIPANAAYGVGVIDSNQACPVVGHTRGKTQIRIIDPHQSLPTITSASATDTLSGQVSTLTGTLDRYAEIGFDVQYEFTAGDWRTIDSANEHYFDNAGSWQIDWRADADGALPPGHYRYVITPRAPTVGNGQTITRDFYVAKPILTGLSAPTSIRIDPARQIEVVESGSHRIDTFSISGVAGVADSFNLVSPADVAFLPSQSTFATLIADASTHRVLRHERSGNTITASLFAGPQYFSSQSGPTGISATAANGGRVYVVDGDNPRIQVFTTGGAFVSSITAPAGVLVNPASVAVSADGSIWVADPASAYIVGFSAAGAVISKVAVVHTKPARPRPTREPGKPVSIDVDANGRIVFSDASTRQVSFVSGTLVVGIGGGLLEMPAGVAVISRSGDFLVADTKANRVLQFRVP